MEKYKIWFIDEEEVQRIIFEEAFEEDFEISIIDFENDINPKELVEYALSEKVDILLIDYDMAAQLWYWWKEIEEELHKINPYFPFLIVTSQIRDAFDHIENPSIVYSKDIWNWDNPKSLQDFKIKLEKIVEKYKENILNSEVELKDLVLKSESNELTPEEEDKYVKLNKFILETHSDTTWASFFTKSTNNKLDALIEKTDELLDKLWNDA